MSTNSVGKMILKEKTAFFSDPLCSLNLDLTSNQKSYRPIGYPYQCRSYWVQRGVVAYISWPKTIFIIINVWLDWLFFLPSCMVNKVEYIQRHTMGDSTRNILYTNGSPIQHDHKLLFARALPATKSRCYFRCVLLDTESYHACTVTYSNTSSSHADWMIMKCLEYIVLQRRLNNVITESRFRFRQSTKIAYPNVHVCIPAVVCSNNVTYSIQLWEGNMRADYVTGQLIKPTSRRVTWDGTSTRFAYNCICLHCITVCAALHSHILTMEL